MMERMLNQMLGEVLAAACPVHVLPDRERGGWVVIARSRVVSHHRTQGAAMQVGRRLARRQKVDLSVWGREGRIRSKDSYGNETAAPDSEH
jgi:hypothetical protein